MSQRRDFILQAIRSLESGDCIELDGVIYSRNEKRGFVNLQTGEVIRAGQPLLLSTDWETVRFKKLKLVECEGQKTCETTT